MDVARLRHASVFWRECGVFQTAECVGWPFKTKSSQQRYRDVGGTSDQRMQLSTARWPCVPNSRWQFSLTRSGMFSGASGPQATKRTNGNIKSNILIWLRRGQSGRTCQVHNSKTKIGHCVFKTGHYGSNPASTQRLPPPCANAFDEGMI